MPRFTSTKSFEQIKRPRKLPERSHLSLEFPQTNGRIFRTYIPFLQNPIITERGQSNLNEYNLVGRAGSLYSYGGAKSRVFNLQFTINFLHMLYSDSTEGIDTKFLRQFNLFYADKERAKKAFDLRPGGQRETELFEAQRDANSAWDAFKEADDASRNVTGDPSIRDPMARLDSFLDSSINAAESREGALNQFKQKYDSLSQIGADLTRDTETLVNDSAPDISVGKGFPHAEVHRGFYRKALGIILGGDVARETPVFDTVANFLIDSVNKAPSFDFYGDAQNISTPQDDLNRLNKLLNAIYVWINLVRATTLNNARNTTQGPPIVRLTHGPMYNNIPCVVSDYNIDMNQEAGYEIETLTPKELRITMTLKEFRSNGRFQENQIESGDNLAGWEAIISNNNIDPYNGDITRDTLEIVSNTTQGDI